MDASRLALEHALSDRIGKPVELVITDNVRSLLSFRAMRTGTVRMRLHHMFLDAPDEVIDEVAEWVERPREKRPAVRAFVEANAEQVRAPQRRRIVLRAKGRVHDLHKIFASVNAEYFESRLEMRITWGRRRRRRGTRSIRLGSYDSATGVITIHRRLDNPDVPEWFVEYVVYHEMLHAALGIEEGENGRRRIHTPTFKKLERRFSRFDEAMALEKTLFG